MAFRVCLLALGTCLDCIVTPPRGPGGRAHPCKRGDGACITWSPISAVEHGHLPHGLAVLAIATGGGVSGPDSVLVGHEYSFFGGKFYTWGQTLGDDHVHLLSDLGISHQRQRYCGGHQGLG